jgi:hypothetical protein
VPENAGGGDGNAALAPVRRCSGGRVIEPASYLAYTPRGAGVLCALFYYAADKHVFGWYTGSQQGEFPATFFMLEDFFSPQQTLFYRSQEDDVYGTWLEHTPEGELPVDARDLVPDAACHELERLQSAFIREWLFYPDDGAAEKECAQYRGQGLPVQAVNIRSRKLNKLDKNDLIWTFATATVDMNVIGFLMRHWPLDHDSR